MNDNEKNIDKIERKQKDKPDLKLVDEKKAIQPDAIKTEAVEQAPPANIYQVIMARMTPEQLAGLGVQLVQVNSSELFWMTSVGQLYPFNNKQAALAAEYTWLMSEPN